MDLRFINREGVSILQKLIFLRNEMDGNGNLIAVYEWQDVPFE